jgi:hypothetical protein
MSPEERQLLSELFERVRGQANAPRDRDAETLIADGVRAQPYAPYLLAQAVLVQEQTLRAADQKIRELEAHANQLEAEIGQLQAQAQSAPQSSGGFLGGLFGGTARPAQPQQAPNPWGAPPQQPQAQQYAPPPQQPGPSPWGAPQQQPQGGGFLRNAMGAAAGVAGGVLLADSLKGLFGGGHGAGGGLGAGLGSGLGGSGVGGGETVVNNFFDTPKKEQDQSLLDSSHGKDQNLTDADYSGDDDFFGGDDDYSSDV